MAVLDLRVTTHLAAIAPDHCLVARNTLNKLFIKHAGLDILADLDEIDRYFPEEAEPPTFERLVTFFHDVCADPEFFELDLKVVQRLRCAVMECDEFTAILDIWASGADNKRWL